jgi:HlyD family secretion protein
MKHKAWIYGGSAAVAVVAASVWAFAPRPLPVELAPVSVGAFETTIDEDGKTRLADRFVVSAPLSGLLVRGHLREGDVVAANAALAQLTPALPGMQDERTQRELQARVEGAQARVQQASARIERAQVALAQAQRETQRSEALARQGFVAPSKVESDRLGSLAAQKEVNAAIEDRHVAKHEVEQAQAALGVSLPGAARLGTRSAARVDPNLGTSVAATKPGGIFVVRAPVAGQVLRVLQTSEAMVSMGTPLVEIGDVRKLEVVADVLTTDAPTAQPGSLVYIERWGGTLPLQGRVTRVEPAAFTKVSALGVEEQRVRVVIALTSPPEQWQALGDGYRVSVRIVTLAQTQALQVPVSAVFPLSNPAEGAAPQFAVFTVDAGRARQVTVELGARNGSKAWIKSGLPTTAQVIVYPPSALRDGARVAQRKV